DSYRDGEGDHLPRGVIQGGSCPVRAGDRVYAGKMTRVHGLDLARALALLGMMLNHLGPANQLMVDYLGPANPVSDGYPSALFAVLAGVSMGIIARRVAPGASEHGSDAADNLLRTRFRLVLRGVILFGLG